MKRANFGFAACAAAVLLGWAGLADAQQRVVLYTSNEATLNKLIAAEFEKATGIAVDIISAGSGVVIKRLQSEKDRPQGDLVWGISRSLLQTNAQYFDSYASEHKNAIPAEFRDPQDRWIGTNLHLLVVLQNTKSIPEARNTIDFISRSTAKPIASPIAVPTSTSVSPLPTTSLRMSAGVAPIAMRMPISRVRRLTL